jgi:hypothetical protein
LGIQYILDLKINKKMKNYITIEQLKDFEIWKSWKHGELELEPSYTEEEVDTLLTRQRGNSYVAVLTKTMDEEISATAAKAPEPFDWRKK